MCLVSSHFVHNKFSLNDQAVVKETSAQLFAAMALASFMDCAEELSNINACREFFSWTTSGIRTALRNSSATELPDEDEIEKLDTKLGQLKNGLWKLKTTMPKMLDLIDRAEWQSHKKQAADLLPDIKDAVYDAEDLLDEFDYYALKLKVEWSKSSGEDHLRDTFLEFSDSVVSNDYIIKINEIQEKLDHVHGQSMAMGLHQALQKFDRSVRPETSSFFHEPKIFGREKELKQLVETLGVRARKRERAETKLHVLPIVGMGGVGKTTMAQQICNDVKVKKHFDRIIWTCVSDDFDTKRLTKEIIERLGGNTSPYDNLDGLMRKLEDCVKSKRFLLVLDDMWDDVLEQDGAGWKRFCEPLKNGAHGIYRLDGLQDLEIKACPKLKSQRVMTFPSSLKKLVLASCEGIESINIKNSQLRSVSELEHLKILDCSGLKSIGTTAIDEIKDVLISGCSELKDIPQYNSHPIYYI
uniref:Uncharacterized protein n=1 Tax=Avena sativa TaxID=4498 RepID=A0ACD5UJY4_AVESA